MNTLHQLDTVGGKRLRFSYHPDWEMTGPHITACLINELCLDKVKCNLVIHVVCCITEISKCRILNRSLLGEHFETVSIFVVLCI